MSHAGAGARVPDAQSHAAREAQTPADRDAQTPADRDAQTPAAREAQTPAARELTTHRSRLRRWRPEDEAAMAEINPHLDCNVEGWQIHA